MLLLLTVVAVCYRNTVEPYRYKFYRWLVFSRIKAALGLDRAKICLSAAAPISTDIKTYFMSIDILIADVSFNIDYIIDFEVPGFTSLV